MRKKSSMNCSDARVVVDSTRRRRRHDQSWNLRSGADACSLQTHLLAKLSRRVLGASQSRVFGDTSTRVTPPKIHETYTWPGIQIATACDAQNTAKLRRTRANMEIVDASKPAVCDALSCTQRRGSGRQNAGCRVGVQGWGSGLGFRVQGSGFRVRFRAADCSDSENAKKPKSVIFDIFCPKIDLSEYQGSL